LNGNHQGKGSHGGLPLQQDFVRPFDLACAPLLRVGLIKEEETKHTMIVDMHHIISDGRSVEIFIREFIALVSDEQLEPLALRYRDFSEWQNKKRETGAFKELENYWLKTLEGELPVLGLPYDWPRPPAPGLEGNTICFELDETETAALITLASDERVTLFMMLLAVYNLFLARITGQEDILVGIVTDGRGHPDLRGIIGMLVNTLVLRSYPTGGQGFDEFLSRLKEVTLTSLENQDYPFEMMVEKLDIVNDPNRNPLFDTLFTLETFNLPTIEIPGVHVSMEQSRYATGPAKFDLMVNGEETDDKLVFSVEYKTTLFKEETIQRFIDYFKKLLVEVPQSPNREISGLEIISSEEKQRILTDFNNTERDYPKDKTIHRLFEEQAEQTPDSMALVGEITNYKSQITNKYHGSVTYSELNKRAEEIAVTLMKEGVKPDTIVAIMVEKSVEVVIGILGILKAGGAYLPIDPDSPQERVDFVLRDSGAGVLIRGGVPRIDTPHPPKAGRGALSTEQQGTPPSALAYIMYTSGSTGKPKGVMVDHRNVVRLVKNTDYIQFNPDDSILQTGAMDFDASTFETWGALLNGMTLCLAGKETILEPEELKVMIRRFRISTMWVTSPLFNRMVQEDIEIFSTLKYLLVGGDVLSPVYISRLVGKYPGIYLINGYGPTENTTFSTTFPIQKEYNGSESIPIGKPIANTTVFILDKYHHLQPVGIAGELCVGGDGVTRGYLNRPELTEKKFLDFSHGQTRINTDEHGEEILDKIYKTGDLARWLPDGNIQFLGRVDNQVKIRGFRIELGEIEYQLRTFPAIKEAVVLTGEDQGGNKYLCAYVVPRSPSSSPLSVDELRDYLSGRLMEYMIPSYFLELETMPLTTGGKINRKALPEPGWETGKGHQAPRDELERRLADTWAEVLRVNREVIGIGSNFFQLGGHSLNATVLLAKIYQALNVTIPLTRLFINPTIQGLADYIRNTAEDVYRPIEPVEQKDYYPVSAAQKRLYLLQTMEKESIGYNELSVLSLEGKLDRQRFRETFRKLIQRHEGLRTSFALAEEEPVQRIWNHNDVDFSIEPVAEGFHIEDFVRPFDLSRAPLFRVGLIVQTPDNHLLMLDIHHIITDGTSQGIFVKDFMALYRAGANPHQLPLLKVQYKDYSHWQGRENQKETMKRHETYWLKEFKAEIPVLDLPHDYTRPPLQSFEGNRSIFELNPEETKGVKALAEREGVTLFMALLAIYNVFLFKVTRQEDIVLGTPIAGRRHPDLLPLMGMFVNTLALRNYPSGDLSYLEFLQEVKERTLEAFENQDYQFEDLVERAGIVRDVSRNPVFDSMFALQNTELPDIEIPGLKLSFYSHERTISKFDFSLHCWESGDLMTCVLEYSTKLLRKETIETLTGYFKRVVIAVIRDPLIKLAEVDIMDETQRKEVLDFSFGITQETDPGETIHRLFEEQALRTPDHVALVYTSGNSKGEWTTSVRPTAVSYGELNKRANQLANMLRAKGVTADTIVGLMITRSPEMIIAMLGILKAGGAYLPIDPAYPANRKAYMLADSGVKLLLINKQAGSLDASVPTSVDIIDVGDETLYSEQESGNLESVNHYHDLLYVIYTSGSTGKPKGVLLEHRTLVNLLQYQFRHVDLQFSRALQFATISFDVSLQEIFSTLLTGGELSLVSEDMLRDIPRLFRFIDANHLKTLYLPSSFLKFIINEAGYRDLLPRGVDHIVTAGEQVVVTEVFRNYLKENRITLHNHYGPSETHAATTLTLPPSGEIPELPSIGKPVMNTSVYIVDRGMGLCPVGISGEVYCGGIQVGRGYLNRPGLTSDKFLDKSFSGKLHGKGVPVTDGFYRLPALRGQKSPLAAGGLLYKTGDLARWLPDGNIQFLGRIDHQVKIRGYRIELEEIESHLLNHPSIDEAVVLAKQDSKKEKYLCAYIVSGQELVVSEVREFLAAVLPDYMVPSQFIREEAIPLTPNGKVDKKALAALGKGLDTGVEYVAPRNEIETKIAEIWKDVLQLEQVGIHDNFFDLGGTSLAVIKLNAKFTKVFDEEDSVMEMFRYTTISSFAQYLIRKREGAKGMEKVVKRNVQVETVKSRLKDVRNRRRVRR
ncbi:MAG: amino acid adenylation domain-containing protein, partial [bacterium]|nr:amino acid adenylation domain-containing protein [bacterium]